MSFIYTNEIITNAENSIIETNNLIDSSLQEFQNEARRITYNMFSKTSEIEDLKYYFSHSAQDYTRKNIFEDYIFFPEKISNLYPQFDFLNAVSINLNNSEDIYLSTFENKFGKKVDIVSKIDNTLVINQVLIDQVTFENLGYLSIYLDSEIIERQIFNEHKTLKPSVIITNEFDTVVYSANTKQELENKFDEEKFFQDVKRFNEDIYSGFKQRNNNYNIFAYIEFEDVVKQIVKRVSGIFVITISIDVLLLYTLKYTFGAYSEQVEDIIETITEVKEGDYSHRILLDDKGSELYNISNGINEMLNSISDYIDTIYQLEVKQRDINLMALQSQINPHFLYNTLEFIRMYAVSEGVDELAEIVYAFSELLRNNISLARETTLAKEIEFVENYIYLYQMRYPNRLAYKVSIDESLTDIMVPKFTIQPLIENYIKHGVDFTRIDNAIHIVAYKEDEYVIIEISDNGRGVDEKKLTLIKERITRDTIDIQSGSSIGLYNVHERLNAYFKDAYVMEIKSELNQGFMVKIKIDGKDRDLTSKLYNEENSNV